MDSFPDLGSLTIEQLNGLARELADEEQAVSYERRVLQREADVVRAERVERLRGVAGEDDSDPGSSAVREPRRPRPGVDSGGIAVTPEEQS